MTKLILPKNYVEVDAPLIFLAGPIKGAPEWHDETMNFISEKAPELTSACPYMREPKENLKQYVVNGDWSRFTRNRMWERHYLDIASKKGAIMFWLPGEVNHKCEKSYGSMTRLEFGECLSDYRNDNSHSFCVGSDGKFSDLQQLLYDMSLDAPDKKMFFSLEETCDEAIKLARN
jgi:hypothetical protein